MVHNRYRGKACYRHRDGTTYLCMNILKEKDEEGGARCPALTTDVTDLSTLLPPYSTSCFESVEMNGWDISHIAEHIFACLSSIFLPFLFNAPVIHCMDMYYTLATRFPLLEAQCI
jgi:hypothetical protein